MPLCLKSLDMTGELVGISNIEKQKLAIKSLMSRLFFSPSVIGIGRGADSIIPDKHQLIAEDLLGTTWFGDYLSLPDGNPHARKRILLADEGGLGKTFSAAICAIDFVRQRRGVIAIVPVKTIPDWRKAFRKLGIETRRIYSGTLNTGILDYDKVNIISKHSLIESELNTHAVEQLESCGLCILDEAHEGFIADSKYDDDIEIDGFETDSMDKKEALGKLSSRIKQVFVKTDYAIALTATPMRHDWQEIEKLFELILHDEEDKLQCLTSSFQLMREDETWLNDLRDNWLSLLYRIEHDCLNPNDSTIFSDKLNKFCLLLSDEEKKLLKESVVDNWENIISSQEKRTKLVKDLHPLGFCFHITFRDDMEYEILESHYRKRISKNIEHQPQYANIKLKLNSREKRCILNCLNSSYKRKSKIGSNYEQIIVDAWENDDRLRTLKHDIEQKLDKICQPQFQKYSFGIVVFAHDIGTGEALAEWLVSNFGEKLLVRKMYSSNNNPDVDVSKLNEKINDKLRLNAANNSKKRKLSVLVCGDGGAVGLNMEWATTIIHWDLYGGAENIAQRSWRLDRRIESFDKPIEVNNSVKTFIFKEFNIHYYTCQESDKIADYNESYRRNRVFLGDYRFIDGKQDEQLIPKEANLEVNSKWTEGSKTIFLNKPTMVKKWLWCQGKINDGNGYAELLNLTVLNDAFDLRIEEFDVSAYEMGYEPEIVQSLRDGETEAATWNRLLSLSSPSERESLKRLYGDYRHKSGAITTFGPPNNQSDTELISLLPTGKLSSFLRSKLIDEIKINEVPLRIACPELTTPDCDFTLYAADIGILKLLENNYVKIAELVFGDELPTGISVCVNNEWTELTKGSLGDHREILQKTLAVNDMSPYGIEADDLLPELCELFSSRSIEQIASLQQRDVIKHLPQIKKFHPGIGLDEILSYLDKWMNYVVKDEYFIPLVYNDGDDEGWAF